MKRIFALTLIVFALLRTGTIDVPERAAAWIGDWSVSCTSAGWWNEPAGRETGKNDVSESVVYRVPIREPDGAFLNKLLDLFDMNSGS